MADKLNDYAKELLRMVIRDYSYYHWSMNWIEGLEYEVWSYVCGDVDTMWASSFGKGLRPADRDRLMDLVIEVNGWYTWSDSLKKEVFIPMNKWLKLYNEWKILQRRDTDML